MCTGAVSMERAAARGMPHLGVTNVCWPPLLVPFDDWCAPTCPDEDVDEDDDVDDVGEMIVLLVSLLLLFDSLLLGCCVIAVEVDETSDAFV